MSKYHYYDYSNDSSVEETESEGVFFLVKSYDYILEIFKS